MMAAKKSSIVSKAVHPLATVFTAETRLLYISLYDPVWCEKIQEFAALNPEFIPFLHLAPGSNGDGRATLYQTSPSDVAKGGRGGIKEYLKWYALQAGVRAAYGYQMWEQKGVREGDYSKLTEKKRTIMQAIDALPEITTEEQLRAVDVKGVGVGGINSALTKFFGREDAVAYSDRAIGLALKKIWNMELTPTKVKKLAEAWKGTKTVGEAWCFCIFRYA